MNSSTHSNHTISCCTSLTSPAKSASLKLQNGWTTILTCQRSFQTMTTSKWWWKPRLIK